MPQHFASRYLLAAFTFVMLSGNALCQPIYDLSTQWSNAANPNGAWTYREANNPLPAVASWQSSLGGWTTAQPGWAKSENGNDRIPFWFKSNGSENFVHDWLANDVVLHTSDTTNGVGNGDGNVVWTSSFNGIVDITGSTWLGRDIGRANHWHISHGSMLLTSGDTFTGDAYSRATPMNFAAGSGGASVLQNIPVSIGDTITLEIVAFGSSGFGEFQGVNFTVTQVPEPSSFALLFLPALAWWRRRRTPLLFRG